jgi:hypothetical protein
LSPQPTAFSAGPGAFIGGASRAAIVRALMVGVPGTAMPSFGALPRSDLWSLAELVASLAERGHVARASAWQGFLARFPRAEPHARKGQRVTPRPGEDGCLRCHAGIEPISNKMESALLAFAAQRTGATCVVCHEGAANGATEEDAHRGLIPNPGSLWVTGIGLGCAKCHSAAGALTTLQGAPLPHPVGGALMNVRSTRDDPSGDTGHGQSYRVPRGLMAQELGKATTTFRANGLLAPDQALADVPVDDPDGAEPLVGSRAYRSWVKTAFASSFLRRVDHADVTPAYDEGLARFHDPAAAGVGELFRKDCSRCHLWDRGFPGAGGRHRSEGCSACHVLYALDGKSQSEDPTLDKTELGRPLKHTITAAIPSAQCAHCHWRGGGYYGDLHYERGMECVDCHGSIDVHGDGNIYPTMHLQVEVGCADCHGTPTAYPWELPVGYGTPVAATGARGVLHANGTDHLLTARGNARTRWVRKNGAAFVLGLDGRRRRVPLLKDRHTNDSWTSDAGRVAMDTISSHIERLECVACHVKRQVQCQGCHATVDMRARGIDWTASASQRSSPLLPASRLETPGSAVFSPSPKALVEPALGVDLQGRVTGLVPGCLLRVNVIDRDGKTHVFDSASAPSGSRDTLAPLIPHAVARGSRTCESCHTSPAALGYGVGADRWSLPDGGRERERTILPSQIYGPLRWKDEALTHGETPDAGVPFTNPFDVNRLVDRGGHAVKQLADPGERPLSEDERALAERDGVCLACHRLQGSPRWKRAAEKLGPGRTPAEHDRLVERLLESFLAK